MNTSPTADSIPKFASSKGARVVFPTADEFARLARKQVNLRIFWGTILAFVVGGTLIAAMDLDFFALPLLVLGMVFLPYVVWHFPRAIVYFTVLAICLLELVPVNQPDSFTDRIPLMLNINTIIQTSFHHDFKALPINPYECILFVAGISSLLRAVFSDKVHLRGGPLLGPILAYIFFVFVGLMVGIATGGDYKIALVEVRTQIYFLIMYVMVVNLVTERRMVTHFLWIIAITVAIKGLLYSFRRFVLLNGVPVTDQGVGSHEEAFFFDCFITLLMVLLTFQAHPKLQKFMLWTLPLVELGNIATNRRAGTAALAVAIPVIFLTVYQAFPERRRKTATIGLSLALCLMSYYFAFRNSNSAVAQPARAIKSQFDPDPRDAGSNAYRDAENIDQMTTINSAPFGYGYGKRFFHIAPIADISLIYDWWDIIPHNSILWIWLRTGTEGFIAFWIMISASVIFCAHVARDHTLDLESRAIGMYGMIVVGSQLIFGLLDIQMVNPRDMMFTATILGLASCVRRFSVEPAVKMEPLSQKRVQPFRNRLGSTSR